MGPQEHCLWKYHALGNDYLVIDPAGTDIKICAEAARLLCNRKVGIGADGLLWGPFFQNESIGLKVFNADGSICNRSGNGMRIFGHYLYQQGYVNDEFQLTCGPNSSLIKIIGTEANVVSAGLGVFNSYSCTTHKKSIYRKINEDVLTIGGEQLSVYCVTNGTPHCIIFCDNKNSRDIDRLGREISSNSVFKDGINVAQVKFISKTLIQAEFWERGAGVVLASGSAAAAAAYVAFNLGKVERTLKVKMQAGTLDLAIDCADVTHVSGRIEKVMKCTLADEFVMQLRTVQI